MRLGGRLSIGKAMRLHPWQIMIPIELRPDEEKLEPDNRGSEASF